MRSAVTISLVPEAKGGPFVFWDDVSAGFEKAAALGFDGVEIFPRSAKDLDPERMRELISAHQLKVAAVGTGAGWVVHKLRLTDAAAEIRRRARVFVGEIIDLAGSCRAPAIIGSMQGRWEGEITRDRALGWLREALEELAPRASRFGVPLLIEPLNRYESNLLTRAQETLDFLNSFDVPEVKLLCDLFHMNIEEASISEALRKAGSRVGHVHLADSNRQAAGFGHTNFKPVADALREIQYNNFLSAEILPLPDAESAARQTIKAFRQFFGG
jgi:sugar phosphate isomerase/epimerase